MTVMSRRDCRKMSCPEGLGNNREEKEKQRHFNVLKVHEADECRRLL
jgi:hypothetical protein